MTRRRTYAAPQPARTNGADAVAVPCAETAWPFDTLIEVTSGERFHNAVTAARAVCGRCPIQSACLVENRREDWARAVITGLSKQQQTIQRNPPRPKAVKSRQEHHDARLADLRTFAAAGMTADQVTAHLSITRDALRIWCVRNGQRDLWLTFAPPRSEAVIRRPDRRRTKAVAA